MIKMKLRKIAQVMSEWPIIGRFVKIGIAVIRLPTNRADYIHRLHMIENQQLPTLLQRISDIENKPISGDRDIGNIVVSTPIALRSLTRELADIRKQLGDVTLPADTLSKRIEFVRQELMFEMRYSAAKTNTSAQTQIETKIINTKKLEAARKKKLRLNIGCGHKPIDKYLNIDQRLLPGVDIVADIHKLPFSANEISEIYTSHLLEHFPQEELKRELLPYFYNLLKKNGIFRVIVPDAHAMMSEFTNDNFNYEDLRQVTFGGQDYNGNFHFNMFTSSSIQLILSEAGFSEIKVIETGRKNGLCLKMEVLCKK